MYSESSSDYRLWNIHAWYIRQTLTKPIDQLTTEKQRSAPDTVISEGRRALIGCRV